MKGDRPLIQKRIEEIRGKMIENGMDCYIVPSFDAHQSEYVADHWKSREWVSGFTGSAGTVVVTREKAFLWTDGRYHIQAEAQLEGSGIELIRWGLQGVPTYTEWISKEMPVGSVVGFDGSVVSKANTKTMEKLFEKNQLKMKIEHDLVGKIWNDRPAMPMGNIIEHAVAYAGKSRQEKFAEVREKMKALDGEYYIIPNLDDIAWLFNIRGTDISYCPFVVSYALLSENQVWLFIDERKISDEVKQSLIADGVVLKPYEDMVGFLSQLDCKSMIYDPKTTSVLLTSSLKDGIEQIEKGDIVTNLKAMKNNVEIDNLKKCQVKDGVAMVKFLHWVKNNIKHGVVTELEVANKLREFRSQGSLFKGESFNTIAGYKEHGAMMHYAADEDSNSTVKEEGLLLFDSGGQYLDGTTDITRTIAAGTITDEERTDFTLTLKGHINLNQAKFLHGATGYYLDILARRPMWEHGIDYKCGTGHGVGYFLSVHEGPQGISPRKNDTVLEAGMIITNEPGVYKAGKHGIRIENTVLVVEAENTEFGQFMAFDVISFCPIDLDAVDPELMTDSEKAWLNDYHQQVYDKLSPYLDDEMKVFLIHETRAI